MAEISKSNGLPYHGNRRSINERDIENARLNNVFHLTGTNPKFPDNFPDDKDIIVFLENVSTVTGTFTIQGNEVGVLSGAIPSPYRTDNSPLRFDGGVQLNGSIASAKGFFLPKK